MKTITYEEFTNVELRSGTIVKVEDFPRAKNCLLYTSPSPRD